MRKPRPFIFLANEESYALHKHVLGQEKRELILWRVDLRTTSAGGGVK